MRSWRSSPGGFPGTLRVENPVRWSHFDCAGGVRVVPLGHFRSRFHGRLCSLRRRLVHYPHRRHATGARGRNRTVTPLSGPGILSPVRLPVSPPGRVENADIYCNTPRAVGSTVGEFVGSAGRSANS